MRIPRYVFTIRFCPLLALISTTGENSSLTIILVITLVQGFFTFFLNSILLLCLRFLWCGWQHWGILVNKTTTILVDKPFNIKPFSFFNLNQVIWFSLQRCDSHLLIKKEQYARCPHERKNKSSPNLISIDIQTDAGVEICAHVHYG